MKKFLLPIILILLTSCGTKQSPETAQSPEASPSSILPSPEVSPTLTPLPTASPTNLIPTPNEPVSSQPSPNTPPVAVQPLPTNNVTPSPQVRQTPSIAISPRPSSRPSNSRINQQQPLISSNDSPYGHNKGSIGEILQQSPSSTQLVSQAITPQPGHLPPKQYIPHLPNSQLTPGAVYANVTKEAICSPGYSKTVAYVSPEVKKQVYNAYGVKNYKSGKYAIDHLISPELGGSNDISNLWLVPYRGEWNARQKHEVENVLHQRVCTGKIPLPEAQHEIATDWIAAYKRYVATGVKSKK